MPDVIGECGLPAGRADYLVLFLKTELMGGLPFTVENYDLFGAGVAEVMAAEHVDRLGDLSTTGRASGFVIIHK